MREAGGAEHGGRINVLLLVCPLHRGWSWSHYLRSYATHKRCKAKPQRRAAPGD
jgi:hypothetical protein